jgi:hypothetical protein
MPSRYLGGILHLKKSQYVTQMWDHLQKYVFRYKILTL